jgi:hypothetical protein
LGQILSHGGELTRIRERRPKYRFTVKQICDGIQLAGKVFKVRVLPLLIKEITARAECIAARSEH